MSPKPAIFALAAGVLGAGIWTAVSYFANLEIGWIAWGIGALVGYAAFLGADGKGSIQTAVMAVVIASLSIIAGKFIDVSLRVDAIVAE